MSGKYVLTSAAIALAVVLAHQHVSANGAGGLKPRVGN
jgi:hypothetical protein